MKSKDFLRSKGILSNDSDHYIIDFHDGREINLGDLLEEYAQQSQPSGMRWVSASERLPDKYKTIVMRVEKMPELTGNGYSDGNVFWWSGPKKQNIYYNIQDVEWLDESSPAGAAEGASEGMAEALRKDIFRLDELRRFHIEPYNLGEMGEVSKIISRLSKLASLSPGVEDGSGWVKVEDGLPEMVEGWSRVEYMTIIKGYTGVWVGKIFKSSFGYSCTAKTSHDIITHWRPLPAPPGE